MLLLLVLANNVFAQVTGVVLSENKDKVFSFVEESRLKCKSNFTTAKIDTIRDNRRVFFKFENEERRVTYEYRKIYKGANPDLDIKGTLTYELDRIEGMFTDLFPIWQTYFNPNENMDNILTKKTSFVPVFGQSKVFFVKSDYNWVIYLRSY